MAPVWMGTHFPSEDGLAHLAWTEVYRALGSDDALWRPFYARSAQWNTPNLAYFGAQYAVGSLLEPHIAQRLIISALIVGWAAATRVLSIALAGRISLGAFASLLLIQSSWLYGGYLSFLVGVPPLLLALALVARIVDRPSVARPWELAVLGLLGVIAFYSHLVSAAVFLMLVAVAALFLRRSSGRAVGIAPSAVPTGMLVASYFLSSSLGSGGMRWEPLTKTVARFAGFAFFRGFAAPTADFWMALAAFVGVVFVLCGEAVRAYLARRGNGTGADHGASSSTRLVLVLAVCLALLYAVSPDGVGDGYNLKGRFQLVLWAWALPALSYAASKRTRGAIIAGVSALVVWQVVTFSARARRFNAMYDSVVVAAAERFDVGSTFDHVSDYEHEAFDGSFIKVLAHAPEDFAYHCGCVLVAGYHPSTSFYWVRTLRREDVRPTYHVWIRQLPEKPATVTVEAAASR